jgi:WD40 repeat protein
VNSVAFSHDGQSLAAGSSDGTARVWDTATGEERTSLPVSANVTSVAFTPDDEALLTGALDGIGRYHDLDARKVEGFGDNIWSLAYDDAGSRLLVGAGTGDGAIHVYDVPPAGAAGSRDDTAAPVAELRAPEEAGVLDGAAAMSPDGSLVAGGTSTGHVVVWETGEGSPEQLAVLAPSTQLIEAVAVDGDGRLLTSIGDDGAAVVWDTEALRSDAGSAEVARVEVDTIPLGVALSPDGRLLAVAGANDRVHLWRLDPSGAVERALPDLTGFENYAIGVAFSPDGRLLAAGSSDASVRVWDVSDPGGVTRVSRLLGPNDTVYSVAWDDRGETLAGASTDGSVWMWDLSEPEDPRALANLLALGGDAFTVTFTPDGERLVAAGSGRVVRMWDTDHEVAAARICAAVGTPLTRREWHRYAPGAPYRPICS